MRVMNASDFIERAEAARMGDEPTRGQSPPIPLTPARPPMRGTNLARRNAEVRRLRSSGVAAQDIALRFGISTQRVYQITTRP